MATLALLAACPVSLTVLCHLRLWPMPPAQEGQYPTLADARLGSSSRPATTHCIFPEHISLPPQVSRSEPATDARNVSGSLRQPAKYFTFTFNNNKKKSSHRCSRTPRVTKSQNWPLISTQWLHLRPPRTISCALGRTQQSTQEESPET